MTTTPQGPLSGLRVVEFDGLGPVPMAAMILADLGCEVIRITRRADASQVWSEVGGSILHRNRRHIPLDLKDPNDRDGVLSLIKDADAVIEGFRPGVMERLGLGPDVCLAANPNLSFVRMTGWGQTGPLAARAGHDINYISLTGALHAMGAADQPPAPPLNLVGDYGGGAMFAVVGLLSAVMAVRAGGPGQVVDVAMTDGSAVLSSLFHALGASGLWSDRRGTNLLDGSHPFYRCYVCADGKHVAVGALEPQFFSQLLAGLDIAPDRFSQFDRAAWPSMEAAFAQAFATRTRDDWADVFKGTDACVSPVLSFQEAAGHPHNHARDAYPAAGGMAQPAPAPRFSGTPLAVDDARRGAANLDEIIRDWTL